MMSRIILSSIMLIVFFFNSYSQDIQEKKNQITVLGSIELKEIADQASFTFSVKGTGSTLRLAVEDANKKVKTITDKLITTGIPSKNISTSQFYSGENLGDKSFWFSKRDYRAILVTLVTVDNMQILDSVLYVISEGEIENVSNITFSLKDELSIRRKARISATMKAKEKAEDIANALGVSLGQVITIEEIEPTKVFPRGGYWIPEMRYPNPFNPSIFPNVIEQAQYDESRGSGFFCSNYFNHQSDTSYFRNKKIKAKQLCITHIKMIFNFKILKSDVAFVGTLIRTLE